MSYLSIDDYINLSNANDFENEDEYDKIAELASNIINSLTGYKIQDFEQLTDFVQNQVKLATATQIDQIYSNGGATSLGSSFTLGKFSYGGDTDSDTVAISPMAYFYLEPTGLLYRGLR